MMSVRQRYLTCSIFFLTVIVKNACEKLPWGSPCKTDKECRDAKMDDIWTFELRSILGHDEHSLCSGSRCKCSKAFQHLELKDNNYVCESTTALDSIFGRKHQHRKCKDGMAYDGDKCRETVTADYSENCATPKSGPVPLCNYDKLMRCNSTGQCGCYKDHFYSVEDISCISKDAYIKKYPEETIAGLDEFCGGLSSEGVPKICNETIMKCDSYEKKCKCTKEFYPSISLSFPENSTCESKASYVKKNNLTSYKVMPGLYCDNSNECITGLTCASNKKCACPHPCKYNNMNIACDCGAVSSMEGASRAVLVGIIGGIAIIVFWWHMIKKIIDKKPIHTKYYDEPGSTEDPTSVPLTEPYRIKSTTTSDYSTPAPVSKTSYPISSVPNRDPSPVPPYSLSPPSDPSAPVGFSAPTAPPLDAAQQPPPYTSNPAPYPTSPVPYASNPTPYPTSPATVPGNSIGPAVNTGPGYPITPDSGQTMENSTGPTNNAPQYSLNPPSAPPAVDIYKPVIQ